MTLLVSMTLAMLHTNGRQRNTPVPGSTTNFRGRRDPALLKQDANKKSGWIDYRKGMDYLDSQLYGQGFQSYSESGAEELNLMKQMYTQQLAQTNKDWAADFYSVDKGKWIYRMQTIKTILTDPEWVKDNASRPIVSQLAIYYNTRTQIARELASRKAGGGAASLEAKDNEDLNRLFGCKQSQLCDRNQAESLMLSTNDSYKTTL
jgi:hypothetical protein